MICTSRSRGGHILVAVVSDPVARQKHARPRGGVHGRRSNQVSDESIRLQREDFLQFGSQTYRLFPLYGEGPYTLLSRPPLYGLDQLPR